MEELEVFRALVIVCPLIFLGGIVDAIVGGGGLITIPAYLLAGFFSLSGGTLEGRTGPVS